MMRFARSPIARVIIAAVLSAITWFAWAWWANRAVPSQALLSGLSQGAVSFTTTAIGSTLLEWFFLRMGHLLVGRVLSVVLVCMLSLALMLTAHLSAGTPNIVLTILPVFTVVVLYCSSYILGLQKLKQKHDIQAVESAAA
ncbi:MAG: hypothetical protein R3F38_00535 [Gammaproteobacteria bacterium]|jgi:hypothetical protein